MQVLNASVGDTTELANEYSNATNVSDSSHIYVNISNVFDRILLVSSLQIDVGGSSSIQNSQKIKQDNSVKRTKDEARSKDVDEMSRLVSEVKEILCGYGEGFLQVKILFLILIF